MKKIKYKCNCICKKYKIQYLKGSTEKGVSWSKQFWNFIKSLLTIKSCLSNNFISTGNGDAFINKETNFVEIFNIYYINIVEKTSGVPREKNVIDTNNTQEIIEGIIRKYERHPSMLKMKNNFDSFVTFDFSKAEVADINSLLKQRIPKKRTGTDTAPQKLVKISANVIEKLLCNIINKDIDNFNVSDNTKVPTIRPLHQKKKKNPKMK